MTTTRPAVTGTGPAVLRHSGERAATLADKASPRVAIYLRRSLTTAASTSVEKQRRELLRWAVELGASVDRQRDVFLDDGRSATGRVVRHGLIALLEAVEVGRYDAVLVWDFSRWTRSRRENHEIAEIMRTGGCALRSLKEPWLVLDGELSFLVQWLADLSARESERLAARISAWHALRLSLGGAAGRAPWGMRKEPFDSPIPERMAPLKRLVPDDEPRQELGGRSRADVIRVMFQWAIDGSTAPQISRRLGSELGLPKVVRPTNSRTIADLIRNPHFAGYMLHNGTIFRKGKKTPRPHQGILTPAEYKLAQQRFTEATKKCAPRQLSLLSKLVHCASCGFRTRGASAEGGSYRCYNDACDAKATARAPALDALVLDRLHALLADPVVASRTFDVLAPPAAAPGDPLTLERQLEALETEWIDGHIAFRDDFLQRQEALIEAAAVLERSERERQQRLPSVVAAVLAGEVTSHVALQHLDRDELRSLLQVLIAKITIARDGNGGRGVTCTVRISWRRLR